MLLGTDCVKVTYLTPFVCQYSGFGLSGFVLVGCKQECRFIHCFLSEHQGSEQARLKVFVFFSIRLLFEKLEPGCQLSSYWMCGSPRGIGWKCGKKSQACGIPPCSWGCIGSRSVCIILMIQGSMWPLIIWGWGPWLQQTTCRKALAAVGEKVVGQSSCKVILMYNSNCQK